MRTIIVGLLLAASVALSGCGGGVYGHAGLAHAEASAGIGDRPVSQGGAVGGRAVQRGSPGRYHEAMQIRTAPCEPFNANKMMNWAKELKNAQHSRSASVSNYDGQVSCSSREEASSSSNSTRR